MEYFNKNICKLDMVKEKGIKDLTKDIGLAMFTTRTLIWSFKANVVSDLQFKLHKTEKEKERALKIQSELVKKYRAFVTALSGLQIKMKEDDLVQVESIFDPGNYFVFKVCNSLIS